MPVDMMEPVVETVRAGGSYVVRKPGAEPELVHRTRGIDEAPPEPETASRAPKPSAAQKEEVSDARP